MHGLVTRTVCSVVAVGALLVLGGCQNRSSSSAPSQAVVRSAAQTAPADLQLTCASEAGTRLGMQNALPVSSAETQPGEYRVDLTGGGTNAVCMIRSDGTVVSVDRTG
jgi:hypothetical protein